MGGPSIVLPEDRPIVAFEAAHAWEAWLLEHGDTAKGLYIKIAKKSSGVPSITYAEAVDVAICHGWIDAIKRRFDDTWFLQKFTPRGPRSMWSEINKNKVQELIKAKLMHPAGMAAVKRAKKNGQWDNAYASASTITVPPDMEAALKKNKKARAFFKTLKGGKRYAFLHRLQRIRKPERRTVRISEYLEMLEQGKTFP